MHNEGGLQPARGYKIMTTPNEALRTILPIAGWGDTQAADVMFTGGADPVLPTPFRIGAAGAATLAASGLAATKLWQVGGGVSEDRSIFARPRQRCAAATTFSSPARTFHPSETPSWASIRAATGAGPISTAIFPIIARRHSACSA